MASSTVRRRRGPRHRHWFLVAICLGVAFAPIGLRRKARAAVLDLHARIARLVPGPTAAAEPGPESERVRLLEGQVTHLQRALIEANSSSELVRQSPQAVLIPADVLPLAGGSDVLHRVALARGTQDGVEPGLPVLAGDTLVGRVETVTASTCEVLLATDPSFRIRASVPRQSQDVEGLLVGDGSGLMTFEPALLDERLAPPVLLVGETVGSSRASILCGVPAVLGVVEAVERPPGAGLPLARVRPLRDLTRLERVVIVKVKEAP